MVLVCLLLMLKQDAQPQLELRAEPAVLYPGQLGRLELLLHVPARASLPQNSEAQLHLPWLESDMPGFVGLLEPDQWLCQTIHRRGDGMRVRVGPHAWTWPHEAEAASQTDRVFRLSWPFRCSGEHEGMQRLPQVVLTQRSGTQVVSNVQTIDVKPLPLPKEAQPTWRLGVGRFRVSGRITPSVIRPNGEAVLQLWVEGDGLLEEIKQPLLARLPGWGLDRFRLTTLPETWSDDLRARCFRWEIQVRADAGALTLPPIAYGFFDPSAGEYRVERVDGPTLIVAPIEPDLKELYSRSSELPVRLKLAPADGLLNGPVEDGPPRALALIPAGVLLISWIAYLALLRRFGWYGAPEKCVRRAERFRRWRAARQILADSRAPVPTRVFGALKHTMQENVGDAGELPLSTMCLKLRQRALGLWTAAEAVRYGPPGVFASDLLQETTAFLDDWKEAECS